MSRLHFDSMPPSRRRVYAGVDPVASSEDVRLSDLESRKKTAGTKATFMPGNQVLTSDGYGRVVEVTDRGSVRVRVGRRTKPYSPGAISKA